MTQAKRLKITTDSIATDGYGTELYPHNDGRSERRDLRLHELDEDYRHQLTHLNRVASESRHSIIGLARPNINGEPKI